VNFFKNHTIIYFFEHYSTYNFYFWQMDNIAEYKKIASQTRRDIVRMVHGVQSGHPGGSLGCVEFFISLYYNVMNIKLPFSMDAKDEDVFFLSNGHISPVFYSVLSRRGFFPVAELGTFRKLDTRLQGHPTTAEHLDGVRIASGSLGQGLSVGCGAAMTKKMNGDKSLVFTLHGDGELQEGQIWEAAMFAAHNKIDNLIATIDVNGQQIDGPVSAIMDLGNLKAKWESFGWEVLEMDGNDFDSTISTLNTAKTITGKGKPICILMTTVMGKGVDFMEGTHKWHGSPPSTEQTTAAMAQLEESFGDY
jgi:transketolase